MSPSIRAGQWITLVRTGRCHFFVAGSPLSLCGTANRPLLIETSKDALRCRRCLHHREAGTGIGLR